jgi:hypothetical protein
MTTTMELEDTPNVPQAIRKKNKLKPYQPQQSHAGNQLQKIEKRKWTSAKLKQRKKLLKKGVVQQQPTIYRRDSLDEDDDQKEEARNEETIADYVADDSDEDNDDARAAKSILATANALSRQILQTMASWTHGAIDGMIVDGAVALSTILGNQANHTDERRDSSYDHDDDFAAIEQRNGGGRSTNWCELDCLTTLNEI